MSEIPSVYWMIIFGAVTFMFCFVLYYLAMLIKESRDAIRDSREMLKSADEILKKTTLIVSDVQEAIATVKGTVDQVNEAILLPIKRVGSAITTVGDFVSGFKKGK